MTWKNVRLGLALLLIVANAACRRGGTSTTNMLNNGGFEYGMMCYSAWQWSTTGEEYRGDYTFALSNDAHAGSYALEIACRGADCLKAAVWSHPIAVEAGRTYALSLFSKCAPGSRAYVYIADASPEIFHDLRCTGSWEENQLSVRVGRAGGEISIAMYNADVHDLVLDDVKLTSSDGSVPRHTIRHHGTRSVAVRNAAVDVDGSPYLALGFFDVPFVDLATAAATGANTLTSLRSDTTDCFNTYRPSYADSAYELGLSIVPDTNSAAHTVGVAAPMDAVVDRFGNHRAQIAWYLADEPDQVEVPWIAIDPQRLHSEYTLAKTKTSLPIFCDFRRASRSTSQELAPFVDSTDFWMAEPYGWHFGAVNRAIQNFNALSARPIWLAQDVIAAALIVPKAYWAVTAGATGLFYFNWVEAKEDPERLQAIQTVFRELRTLTPVIFAPSAAATVSNDGVQLLPRTMNGKTYLIAASADAISDPVAFTVPGLSAGKTVTVLFENRTLQSRADGFSDTFPDATRHVYSF